jgi:thioredoxin-like negative regulator of GroEL
VTAEETAKTVDFGFSRRATAKVLFGFFRPNVQKLYKLPIGKAGDQSSESGASPAAGFHLLISFFLYIGAAGVGFALAYLLSRPEELRPLRLSQMVLVPTAFVMALALLPRHAGRPTLGDLQNFVQYLAVAGFTALLLAPNIAHYVGIGFSNFVDPQDWTPWEEEIALRPIQRLIDRDRFQEALEQLDELLEKHKPTYEALLLKSKLLNHFSSVDETLDTLVKMIPLSHSVDQQLAVMEAIADVEKKYQRPAAPFVPQTRRIRIRHELVVFPSDIEDRSTHFTIPAGEYQVEETNVGTQRWLNVVGQNLGNAKICWEAVEEIAPRPASRLNSSFIAPIAQMHGAITKLVSGHSHFQTQARAKKLLKEAVGLIREDNWSGALPLLQKASSCAPDSYEIAYRLMQAVRRTESPEKSFRMLHQVLNQSRWSDDEQAMLTRD